MNNADKWKLDSGLKDDFDFSISSAYFSPHADYRNGEVLQLFLIGIDVQEDEPYECRMSIGSDWNTADGGRSISHPKKSRINKSTIYGHWIAAALEVPELCSYLMEQDPLIAETWVGLTLHLENTEVKFGKNIDPQERLLPTALLSIEGQQLTLTGQPTIVTTAARTPAQVVADAIAAKGNGTSPLHSKMLKLATDSPDFNTFLKLALSDDDVLSDPDLSMAVADENGIWAQAQQS